MRYLMCLILLLPYYAVAQFQQIAQLEEAKLAMSSAVVGDSVLLAGGNNNNGTLFSTVEVYDLKQNIWKKSMQLSKARSYTKSIVGDSGVYFVGGLELDNGMPVILPTIDIYKKGKWFTDTLPSPAFFQYSFKADSLLIFCGGFSGLLPSKPLPGIFYYNEKSNKWSVDTVDNFPINSGNAFDGTHLVIAGGNDEDGNVTDLVKLYDIHTKEWTTARLSVARSGLEGVYANGKFFFIGGSTASFESTTVIDVYDGENWSTLNDYISAKSMVEVEVLGAKLVIAGGGEMNILESRTSGAYQTVEIYDMKKDEWEYDYLVYSSLLHTMFSYGNTVYAAGGFGDGVVHSFIQAYDLSLSVNDDLLIGTNIFPNPAHDLLNIKLPQNAKGEILVEVYSMNGVSMISSAVEANSSRQTTININHLPKGVYILKVSEGSHLSISRFVKE